MANVMTLHNAGKGVKSAVGKSAGTLFFDGTRAILDLVYRDAALVLLDAGTLISGSANAAPLFGFTYEAPSSYTLLKYQYSEHPYLNRQSIISGYVKENTELTINSRMALTFGNGLVQAIAITKGLLIAVEKYCDQGGRFGLINVYDAFASNLVLQELRIIPSNSGRIDEIGLEWSFKKLLFSEDSVVGTLADSVANIANGVPA